MFLEKYQQYLDLYTVINEATEQETILTRFLTTIKPARELIENLFDYRIDVDSLPDYPLIVSRHVVYSLIARSKFYGLSLLTQLYQQNENVYLKSQGANYNSTIDNEEFPKITPIDVSTRLITPDDQLYFISNRDLNNLLNTVRRACPYIKSRIALIGNWFGEDPHRIELGLNHKFLLTKSHNIFTLTPYANGIVFTTAYPSDKTDLPNKPGNVVLRGA